MSQQRRTLIAGNWKMNGGLAANAQLLEGLSAAPLDSVKSPEVLVCVPAVYLAQVEASV
jgi:triosephosphate isomerase